MLSGTPLEEDAWFLYQLVLFYADRQLLDEIYFFTDFFTDSSPSQRKDLELLCSRAWDQVVDVTNPWVHHKSKTKGCAEGIFSFFMQLYNKLYSP